MTELPHGSTLVFTWSAHEALNTVYYLTLRHPSIKWVMHKLDFLNNFFNKLKQINSLLFINPL